MRSLPIPQEDLAKAPRVWKPNRYGMMVRVIDPKWLRVWHENHKPKPDTSREWFIAAHEEIDAIPAFERSPVLVMKPRWRRILEDAARRHNVTVTAIIGPSRGKHIIAIRQEAMWLMHDAGLDYAEIGRRVGGRDHTTAMHGVWRHVERTAEARVLREREAA